jgi:hypothetical protein
VGGACMARLVMCMHGDVAAAAASPGPPPPSPAWGCTRGTLHNPQSMQPPLGSQRQAAASNWSITRAAVPEAA